MNNIPLLSFFAGGGFLDLGFEMAGFDIAWSNEVHSAYAELYRAGISSWRQANNHPKANLEPIINTSSIGDLSRNEILDDAFGSRVPDLYGIIGGPPCQDFTASGRNEGQNGDRGRWTQVYIDLICELKPAFFLMENVPGLYKKKHNRYFTSIVRQLSEADPGYLTTARILSALELGIPQDRDRLFLLGFRKDIFGDAIANQSLTESNSDWYPWPIPRFTDVKSLNWPEITPFGEPDIPVPNGIPLELTVNDLVADYVEDLPNGKEAFKPYSEKFKSIAEGDVAGKSFKRLHRYRYSPTVWYGNNEVHLHPWKPRRLSVREALRIQTVPDTYVLPETHTLTDKFKTISNGVPTELARQIAASIHCYISSQSS